MPLSPMYLSVAKRWRRVKISRKRMCVHASSLELFNFIHCLSLAVCVPLPRRGWPRIVRLWWAESARWAEPASEARKGTDGGRRQEETLQRFWRSPDNVHTWHTSLRQRYLSNIQLSFKARYIIKRPPAQRPVADRRLLLRSTGAKFNHG